MAIKTAIGSPDEDPKKKKKDESARDKKYPMNPYKKGYNEPTELMRWKKDHKNPEKPKETEKPKPKSKNPYNDVRHGYVHHGELRRDSDMKNKKDTQHPHEKPGSPKKDWDHEKKKPGYPTDHLFSEMAKKKASVKIEPLKKKTTESVLKEKMAAKEKLKKKSPKSRARPMLPKTKKKKK
jgi:hypothetical protein